jgi:hypothetical protein
MIFQTVDRASYDDIETSFKKPSQLQPLVESLESILKEIDGEYERERDNLSKTLPDTCVKDRALAMLKARHRERRRNYVRELTVILGQQEI